MMTSLTATMTRFAQGAGRVDRVWLSLGLALLTGLALAPSVTLEALAFVLEALLSIAPFLALAIATAAGTKASGADSLIARAFSGHGAKAIVVAAIFGALSPFCSCGVIPLIAALLAMGVPLPAVMAFWLASPIMDPEMYFLTAGPLGFIFATDKTYEPNALALLGGIDTWALIARGGFADALKPGVGRGVGGGCGGAPKLAQANVEWRFYRDPERRRVFARESLSILAFLSKWLILAFALESLMLRWLPADLVANLIGGESALNVPLAALVGMPAYLNGYAAIPLVDGLMDLGMAPGAALAFMTAGAVSSIPAAIAVHALVRWPVFLWYLGVAFAGSVMVGYAFQYSLA